MNGLLNGAGWREIKTNEDFEFLNTIKNESKGNRHVPLQHGEAIRIFNDRLAAANVNIKEQHGLLSPNQQKFIFMTRVGDSNLPDLDFFLGFLSFNDKSRSLTNLRGTHVFCCSNGVISSESIGKKQKHLSHVNDGAVSVFDSGIEDFWQYRDNRLAMIEREKQIEVDDRMFADIILDMHKSKVFGKDPAFIGKVVNEFVAPVPRHEEFGSKSTLWGLENAMTEMYKSYNPISNIKQFEEFERIISPHLER